jgi:hypothetical protein
MRAVNLRFYNKRLSESRASEQNQEQQVGAGWTAYYLDPRPGKSWEGTRSKTPQGLVQTCHMTHLYEYERYIP